MGYSNKRRTTMIKYEVKVYPNGAKEWFLNGEEMTEDVG